jgi:hypothetical protein
MIAAKTQSDVTDPLTSDPPLDETLEARARRFEADNIKLRAQLAAHDKANAKRLARAMAKDNPDRDFQPRLRACGLVGLDLQCEQNKAWRWFRRGLIYGYYVDGTSQLMLCVNDLRDKVNKTGRHG